MQKFKLSKQFVQSYSNKQVNWGFNNLGYFIYKRTYARNIFDQNGNILRTQQWFQTVKRVVQGSYTYQKTHCKNLGLPWDNNKAQKSAQIMYDKIFNFKFLPPGRGLWITGTQYIDKHGSMALNNCGFVSTQNIDLKNTQPFQWCMTALMLGVGVGFDTNGANKITIKQPQYLNPWTKKVPIFQIPDSRQGWVQALRWKLKAYFDGKPMPQFDYSLIRPEGQPIKGFGGVSSGYIHLKQMLDYIDSILKPMIGKKISISNIVDIMNNIARCVVSGNIRRSAQIALGDVNSQQYVNLKNPDLHKQQLYHHRWASNNSIIAQVGKTDYSKIVHNIIKNGQPGIVWLQNCKNYSRMNNGPDYSDTKVVGVNPCVTGDTLITTLQYGKITMLQLIKLFQSRNIINILSCDIQTGKFQFKPVIWAGLTRQNAQVFTVLLSDGISQLKCTQQHKIFCVNRNQYVCAMHLTPEDHILKSDGSIIKVAQVFQVSPQNVYDITVQDNHNFFANDILIHNCSQITLQSFQLCNLVQTFPSLHQSFQQFMQTLKYAYLYAKSITLVNTQSPQTNAVMLKNRRIGVSMTGIIDAFVKFGRRNFLQNWCKKGYDIINKYDIVYSDWLCVPRSKKRTTVKPSGSISLLAGVSPGIHYPHSKYYIRRVRISKSSDLLNYFIQNGYNVEDDVYTKDTSVIQFPVITNNYIKGKKQTTIWQQLANAADVQRYWVDNSVSITVTFKQNQYKDIVPALQIYEDKLKCVSFLKQNVQNYKQLPYQQISQQKYNEMIGKISTEKKLDFIFQAVGQKFCKNDSCTL